MTKPNSTEELFNQSGGGAPLYFNKYSEIGDSVEGIVFESTPVQARDYESNVLKFWDDGSPMMQLSITLKTNLRDPAIENDDGRRRVFLRWWGSDRSNTLEAVQRAGDSFVRDGAWMRITFTGFGEQKDKKLNPPKVFEVAYKAPPTGTEKLMSAAGQPTAQPSASAHGAPPAPAPSAVDAARAVQVDRKAMIAKVQKLAAAGFSEAEVVDMVPGMSAEAVSAILNV